MKTFWLSIATLGFAASATHAQNLKPAQVPAAVVATFMRVFPQAKAVRWEKEDNRYEAGFAQGGSQLSALISAAGELEETETSLAPSALPAPVRQALAKHYKGLKVSEAAKIVAAKTGAVSYEAEVRENGKSRDILFTADGHEVSKK